MIKFFLTGYQKIMPGSRTSTGGFKDVVEDGKVGT